MESEKINTTMEYLEEEGLEYDDSLSFCNLSVLDNKQSSVLQSPRDSSAGECFEFFSTQKSHTASYSAPDIIFCGKIIHEVQDELNEYQKRDYLAMVRSNSFRRPPSYDEEKLDVFGGKDRSKSLRFMSSQSVKHSTNYQIQKVNITSLTSMSAKSRRRMFMFGPVKFKPEMELSAIKERQGRRVPTTIFPAPAGGGKTVIGGRGVGGEPRGKSHHWGIMRSLRGRSHLGNVLAKSVGCVSPGAAMGKGFTMAN